MAKTCCLILIVLVGIFGGLIGTFLIKLGVLVKPIETLGYNCKHLEKSGVHTRGPEDILIYNSTILFATSNNNFNLWEIGKIEDAPDGSIFLLKNHQSNNTEVIGLKLVGFPSGIRFHPHGGYIRKQDNLLFVINHSYYSGNGDRVEVFKINFLDFSLVYQNSIQLPPSFVGVANNLVVTAKGQAYITKYLASEDPLTGRQTKSLLLQLEYIMHVLFSIQQTHVYKCTFQENWSSKTPLTPTCIVQEQTNSIMANGITWDGKQTLYVADTTKRVVKRYNITENQLQLTGTVEMTFSGDNVEFDPSTERLYTAGPTKAINHITFTEQGKKMKKIPDFVEEFWCGVGYVDTKTFTFTEVANFKSSVYGCSSAYISKDKIFIGSWTDKALVECTRK